MLKDIIVNKIISHICFNVWSSFNGRHVRHRHHGYRHRRNLLRHGFHLRIRHRNFLVKVNCTMKKTKTNENFLMVYCMLNCFCFHAKKNCIVRRFGWLACDFREKEKM